MKRFLLILLAITVTQGLSFSSGAQAAVNKPSAPTVVSITSSAKTGKVTITVRISLPKSNGGSKITGSQVFASGKSCTIKNLGTSCKIKDIQANQVRFVSAHSKNSKGFGAKSKAIRYMVGLSYPSKPIVSPTTPTTPTVETTFNVTNVGATSYRINGQTNPTLTVIRGVTYTFVVNVPGHPFWLQKAHGPFGSSNTYSFGVTNGGADRGTITWKVPLNAPDELSYVCQYHSSQNGRIKVVNAN